MLRGAIFVVLGAAVLISGQQRYQYQGRGVVPSSKLQGDFGILQDTKNLTFVLSANAVPNKDLLDFVDPFVKVYSTNKSAIEPEKFGTTEVVEDSENPEFTKVFWYQWKKGNQQKWTFKLRDEDALRPDDHLGEVTVDVDDYVARGEKLNVSFSDGGFLLIQKTTPIRFRLHARDVPRSDPFGGKSDPFVKCYWSRGVKGNQIKFFTTEVVDNVENVDFNQTIEFANFIPGTDQWWTFKIRDSDGINDDDHLGEVLIEVDSFVEKRQAKIARFGNDGKATLGITPVP